MHFVGHKLLSANIEQMESQAITGAQDTITAIPPMPDSDAAAVDPEAVKVENGGA